MLNRSVSNVAFGLYLLAGLAGLAAIWWPLSLLFVSANALLLSLSLARQSSAPGE